MHGGPPNAHPDLRSALIALRTEARAVSRTYRLTCYDLEELESGLFALHVGGIHLGADWEGARAYRPLDIDTRTSDAPEPDPRAPVLWAGEVVEVDEVGGVLYIAVNATSDLDRPCRGDFLVKPFGFLDNLAAALRQQARKDPGQLELQLRSTLGSEASNRRNRAPIDDELGAWWDHERPLLWGPPGTGKTTTLARLVAAAAGQRSGRILVVSTTNKATDEIALRIHRFAQNGPKNRRPSIRRIGAGADASRYQQHDAMDLLQGAEAELLTQVARLRRRLAKLTNHRDRALLRRQLRELMRLIREASGAFLDRRIDVLVATSYRAVAALASQDIAQRVAAGMPPFSTVVVDEAGLVSRIQTTALSLLAGTRFVLAGDPRQLAPISRMARVLPPEQERWLASSGLSHLRSEHDREDLHLLTVQHRMAPAIRAAVAGYQYDGVLEDADHVVATTAAWACDEPLREAPRAIWYVLDEDRPDPVHLRAQRTETHRSWLRTHTTRVLERLFAAHPSAATSSGLFISPFVGQARLVRRWLAERGLSDTGWTASTVHAQQGAEADYVVFDTVNAGSVGFSPADWRRLVNVGLSRARQLVIVLASREEMQQPYLQPLVATLEPRVLKRVGSAWRWEPVQARVRHLPSHAVRHNRPESLGAQLEGRKRMRAVMSAEQQRLCGHRMDGRPRLVRGVAGSGKTIVLAHWLADTLRREPDYRVLVAFANRSLQGLIMRHISDALGRMPSRGEVVFQHAAELMADLRTKHAIDYDGGQWDYDEMAGAIIDGVGLDAVQAGYDALFVDEAQDFGPRALHVLTRLVRQTDPDDANARQVVLFYDNAQNIYARGTPRWSDMGLDMRGRSTVMKESFRSTQPIAEFALNLLFALQDPVHQFDSRDPDTRELVGRGLIDKRARLGRPWWTVHFNQVQGPPPEVSWYTSRTADLEGLVRKLTTWIEDGVRPGDVAVLVNVGAIGERVVRMAAESLAERGARIRYQTSRSFEQADDLVIVSTVHSFKGYDAEIVAIPACESFQAEGEPLPRNLYVGATRARSVVRISGSGDQGGPVGAMIVDAVKQTLDAQLTGDSLPPGASLSGRFHDLLEVVGAEHEDWLARLFAEYELQTDVVVDGTGAVVAEPVFWFSAGLFKYACFGSRKPSPAEVRGLEGMGFYLLQVGVALM